MRTVKNLGALSKGFNAVKKTEGGKKTQRRCGKNEEVRKILFRDRKRREAEKI